MKGDIKKRYKKALKDALRIGREVVIDSLPEDLREYHKEVLKKREKKKVSLSTMDRMINIKKYYPWSYRNMVPTLVLQGWYDLKLAKKRYRKYYGKDALKYVHWIKGDEALARDFKIGSSLLIGDSFKRIQTKFFFTHATRLTKTRKSFKRKLVKKMKAHDASERERGMIEACLNYGNKLLVDENTSSYKKTRIQNLRQAQLEAKKDLYEVEE